MTASSLEMTVVSGRSRTDFACGDVGEDVGEKPVEPDAPRVRCGGPPPGLADKIVPGGDCSGEGGSTDDAGWSPEG